MKFGFRGSVIILKLLLLPMIKQGQPREWIRAIRKGIKEGEYTRAQVARLKPMIARVERLWKYPLNTKMYANGWSTNKGTPARRGRPLPGAPFGKWYVKPKN